MLSEADFLKHLELAIQFGNPFLFENIDEDLDPLLDPVLEKNIYKEGNGLVIKLGTVSLCLCVCEIEYLCLLYMRTIMFLTFFYFVL
jgi:ATP-binding dynein motor region